MTGGAATVAFGKETSFMGALEDSDSDGNPEYYLPGRNLQIQTVELSNALRRMRTPDSAESVESIAGNLEGAFTAEWVLNADRVGDVHDIVFNDAGTGFTDGVAATSRWFTGIDYIGGTAERELIGVTPTEFRVEYTEGGMIRQSLTAVYGDEESNTSITPSNIQTAGDGQSVPSHGADLTVDTVSQTKLESATLSVSNIARFQRGASRTPLEAVIAAPEATLDVEAVFSEADQLELAYGGGGSAATTPQDSLAEASGTLSFDVDGATATTYNLSAMKADSYGWEDLVAADSDLSESVSLQVNGVSIT